MLHNGAYYEYVNVRNLCELAPAWAMVRVCVRACVRVTICMRAPVVCVCVHIACVRAYCMSACVCPHYINKYVSIAMGLYFIYYLLKYIYTG